MMEQINLSFSFLHLPVQQWAFSGTPYLLASTVQESDKVTRTHMKNEDTLACVLVCLLNQLQLSSGPGLPWQPHFSGLPSFPFQIAVEWTLVLTSALASWVTLVTVGLGSFTKGIY